MRESYPSRPDVVQDDPAGATGECVLIGADGEPVGRFTLTPNIADVAIRLEPGERVFGRLYPR